ncbi:MAG: cobalamin B12-binding domain protein, partial [Acidobacteria bacterium]|nr:cobalamin B12-binding domain protein [Acidobacteriota bacterium]NIO58131.1 cobalamin B12-binding domain protein [Acidobacteriota bacterium]NIQ29147.1 cobalamin B12-binding domain protein [Acidobacteriota bacterium]NIQ83695.1 cobalamin B12-binding domain protein [Acidobacteriota bacterium]
MLACVAGNVHDIGVRATSDFFEMAGWRAINLGADVPHDEIARSVQFFDADVVVLAAALDP